MYFGDFISYVPGDWGATALCGLTSFTTAYNHYPSFLISNPQGNYVPRNSSGQHTMSAQRFQFLKIPSETESGGMPIGYNSTASSIKEPDLLSNRLLISRPILIQDEAYPLSIRGEMPGMACTLNKLTSLPTLINPNTILTLSGERFMYIPLYNWSGNYGSFLLSLDKSWSTAIQ